MEEEKSISLVLSLPPSLAYNEGAESEGRPWEKLVAPTDPARVQHCRIKNNADMSEMFESILIPANRIFKILSSRFAGSHYQLQNYNTINIYLLPHTTSPISIFSSQLPSTQQHSPVCIFTCHACVLDYAFVNVAINALTKRRQDFISVKVLGDRGGLCSGGTSWDNRSVRRTGHKILLKLTSTRASTGRIAHLQTGGIDPVRWDLDWMESGHDGRFQPSWVAHGEPLGLRSSLAQSWYAGVILMLYGGIQMYSLGKTFLALAMGLTNQVQMSVST
eukprot:763153-Hanusia_phi.AAC.11